MSILYILLSMLIWAELSQLESTVLIVDFSKNNYVSAVSKHNMFILI